MRFSGGSMRAALATAAALVGMGASAVPAMAAETVYGLTADDKLVSFSSAKPGVTSAPVTVTGLGLGEDLLGIDFRPATGQLYGVTRAAALGRVYRIDQATGAATLVTSVPFALDGADIGLDFNPQADAIRIHIDQSATDDNLRVSPVTGNLVQADTDLAFVAGDPNVGENPNPVASAYSSNFPGTSATKLYAIETGNQIVTAFAGSPNDGNMTTRGTLGVTVTDEAGFDIAPSGEAFAALEVSGSAPRLYRVDLDADANAAQDFGVLGNAAQPIDDIAIAPRLRTFVALTNGTPQKLFTFRSDRPGTTSTPVNVTGLLAGDTLIGIDTRNANGAVYGAGLNSDRLYTLEVDTGAATLVGTAAFTPSLTGTNFGFDFNPAADRLRIVSDAEQNKRLNPDTGASAVSPSADDTALTPAGNVVGAAYTNPFERAANTTLFGIDSNSDQLVRQGDVDGTPASPDGGALTNIGALDVDTTGTAGYDIVPEFNQGFAALNPNATTVSNLYSVNSVGSDLGSTRLVGAIDTPGTELVQGLAFLNEDLISVASTHVFADEGEGNAVVTLARTGGSDRSATVNVTTGSESATAGFDFGTPNPTTVAFAAGQTVATVSIPILDDVGDEPEEDFLVRLSGSTGGAGIGKPNVAEVAIHDNDATPATPPGPIGEGQTITGSPGADRITGTPGDDIINCGEGNDVVSGGGGNDVINCGGGNDRVDGGAGNDRIDGENGNDRLSGGSGDDDIDGGSGNDRLGGGSGDDALAGESGNDRVSGNSGNDRGTGSSGNDRMAGNQGDDRLSGNSGRDSISGNSGDDRIGGGSGNDRLSGNSGDDRISGNSGADRLRGGTGTDRLSGGPGRDVTRQD